MSNMSCHLLFKIQTQNKENPPVFFIAFLNLSSAHSISHMARSWNNAVGLKNVISLKEKFGKNLTVYYSCQ